MTSKNNHKRWFCWCGCGEECPEEVPFRQGHDVKAALSTIIVDWGSVQKFVEAQGYGPGLRDYSLHVTHEELLSKQRGKPRPRLRSVSRAAR